MLFTLKLPFLQYLSIFFFDLKTITFEGSVFLLRNRHGMGHRLLKGTKGVYYRIEKSKE